MKPANALTRDEMLDMLERFAKQRPGIEHMNYASPAGYRSESRQVTADLSDFRALLSAVRWRGEINANAIRAALQSGGRLTLDDAGRLDYFTGQYFPTEYRRAACRVLAGLLWATYRESMTTPTGDAIRKRARAEFSRRVASRYFN